MNRVGRIIDVNQNRCVEGLRVLEEYCRFICDDPELSTQLRTLRHDVRKCLGQRWISHRDSSKDVGKIVSASNKLDQKSGLAQILRANSSRIEESLRVIEEYLKILGQYELSKLAEVWRFTFYGIEKQLMEPWYVKGLYALTADGTEEEILEQVKLFIDYKVPWIQYRDKVRSKEAIRVLAEKVATLVKESESKLIINDHADIADAVGAHGVHVGQDDMSVLEVRQMAPELLVGVSTHNREQLNEAVDMKPDYIALGPIFDTKTKVNPEHCDGLGFAEYARAYTNLPLVGIGGIDESNLESIMGLGIDSLAMTASIRTEEGLIRVMKFMNHSEVR